MGTLWVGFVNKQNPIVYTDSDVVYFKEQTHFGKKTNRCFLIGNTLYFLFKEDFKETKYVNIRGIWENPEEAFIYPSEGCDKKCFDSAVDDYPLPLDMYEKIVGDIFRKELNIVSQTVTDEFNNARNDNQKTP